MVVTVLGTEVVPTERVFGAVVVEPTSSIGGSDEVYITYVPAAFAGSTT